MTGENWTFKGGIRVLGIDDTPFFKGDRYSFIIGVIMRLDGYIEGIIKNRIEVDGNDVNLRILEMIDSRFKSNIRAIILNGITFGGFNICDIYRLNYDTGIPVISVTGREPDIASMENAIKLHLKDLQGIGVLRKMDPVPVYNGKYKIYINYAGINLKDALRLIVSNTVRGKMPEAIRIADIVSKVSGYD